jgi:hypothetical protein
MPYAATTAVVAALVALAVPVLFVAVTVTVMTLPTSASTGL